MKVPSVRVQIFIAIVLLICAIVSTAQDYETVEIYEKIDRVGGVQSGGKDDMGNVLEKQIMDEFTEDFFNPAEE